MNVVFMDYIKEERSIRNLMEGLGVRFKGLVSLSLYSQERIMITQ